MKRKLFSELSAPPIVAMIQCHTADECITKIKASLADGAEAIGVQLCRLNKEETTCEKLTSIMEACQDKPVYITSYRSGTNEGKSDEACAELLIRGLQCGATLCDIPGDFFDKNGTEITVNKDSVNMQKALIDKIHSLGGEVLISTHNLRELTADEILNIARLQAAHGADVIKIVVKSDNFERLSEYIGVIAQIKRELRKPLLFLDCGACAKLLRRVGPNMGTCMYLCVHNHGELDTVEQPLISTVKIIRENIAK